MGKDMATKSQVLDKRTNTANAIIEAADWLVKALETHEPSTTREYAINALRWLEQTGVLEILPPSTNKFRIGGRND